MYEQLGVNEVRRGWSE